MYLKLLGLLIIATAIKSEETHKYVDYHSHPKYTFSYGVEDFKTGDYKMHKEERNGDGVKGEYRVADPNGSIRTVTYTADKEHGFQAVVKQSEPIEAPRALKEVIAEHKQIEELSTSSHYNYDHDGLSTKPKPDNLKQQMGFKYTPSINTLYKFTENLEKKDQMRKQDIKKNIYSHNQQFHSNQQENINGGSETPKTGMDVNNKQFEEVKPTFQFVQKVNAGKPKEVNVKNVAQQFNFEFPDFKLENQHYNHQKIENNAQSTYFPVDFHSNFKQNAVQKPLGSFQSVPQVLYPNYGYDESTKENDQQLFHQSQTGKVQNQDNSEQHKSAYSYQNVLNGKSPQRTNVIQDTEHKHQQKTSINKPQLYFIQQQIKKSKQEVYNPVVNYQTVSNGQKMNLMKTQENVKYRQVPKTNQGAEFKDVQGSQQIYNIKSQQYPHQNIVYGKSFEIPKLNQNTERNQQFMKHAKPQLQNAQKLEQLKGNSMEVEEKPAVSYQTIINGYTTLGNSQEMVKYNQAPASPYQSVKNGEFQEYSKITHQGKLPIQQPKQGSIQGNQNAISNEQKSQYGNINYYQVSENYEGPNYELAQPEHYSFDAGLGKSQQFQENFKDVTFEHYNANLQKPTQSIETPKLVTELKKKESEKQFAETYYKPQIYKNPIENHQLMDLKKPAFNNNFEQKSQDNFKVNQDIIYNQQKQDIQEPAVFHQTVANNNFQQVSEDDQYAPHHYKTKENIKTENKKYQEFQDFLKSATLADYYGYLGKQEKPQNVQILKNEAGFQQSKVTLDKNYKPQYEQYQIQTGNHQPYEYSQHKYQPNFPGFDLRTFLEYKDLPTFQFQQSDKY